MGVNRGKVSCFKQSRDPYCSVGEVRCLSRSLDLSVRKLLDAAGRRDVLLTGGGIIPLEDMTALEGQGTGKLFGPGTPTSDLIKYIQEWAAEHVAA